MNNLSIFVICILLVLLCFAVAWAVRRWHKPETAADVQAAQAREAAVLALQWAANAEHARALAKMYAKRRDRLNGPTYTPGPHTERIYVRSFGGGSAGGVVSGDTGGVEASMHARSNGGSPVEVRASGASS